jgi:hypothetical protein
METPEQDLHAAIGKLAFQIGFDPARDVYHFNLAPLRLGPGGLTDYYVLLTNMYHFCFLQDLLDASCIGSLLPQPHVTPNILMRNIVSKSFRAMAACTGSNRLSSNFRTNLVQSSLRSANMPMSVHISPLSCFKIFAAQAFL